jgi:hypothetical protein
MVMSVRPLFPALVCGVRVGYVRGRFRLRGGNLLGVTGCIGYFVDIYDSGLTAGATKG